MGAPTTAAARWPELQRVKRAIVVVDVVESVRLLQECESDAIDRWRRFVNEVRLEVLPRHDGRLVKSLGDGMLLEFSNVRTAAASSLELQRRIGRYNAERVETQAIRLRVGMHVADVVADELDIYGAGVNLAARLAGAAGPGEIVISADVRGELVGGIDGDIEDLGECWLKNVEAPVRAARLGPPSAWRDRRSLFGATPGARETVSIAVLPFESRQGPSPGDPLGHLIAGDTIARLSRTPPLRVISRLSSEAFAHRDAALDRVASTLGVDYVVHGTYSVTGGTVRVRAELDDAAGGCVAWSGSYEGTEPSLLHGDEALVEQLTADICRALIGSESHRAFTQPLPTLASYTILLGAVTLLHSLSSRDFERAREMLEYLAERHPNAPTPRAWLGLWHVMRVGQGWSTNSAADANAARALVAAALDADPGHSLSLAIDGLVCAYVQRDFATAAQRYDDALRSNPNEALAWLYRSALNAYREQGAVAVADALHAQALSPLDPWKYYYDNFTSTALLANGDIQGAIDYGRRSLRANRMHGPTLRILAIAYSLAGDAATARAAVDDMLRLEPGFTVAAFRERYPGRAPAQVERYADALSAAGLPP